MNKQRLLSLFFLTVLMGAHTKLLASISKISKKSIPLTVRPTTILELQTLVMNTQGPLAIAGAQYSQGEQTTCLNGTVIDMTGLATIISLDRAKKLITMQTGVTWKQVQECIDPVQLSVKVMQSYNNFSVGGSLGVNAHGRYLGYGPLINTVHSITVLLADGSLVTASHDKNYDLFCAAIGGYGGVGIITEVTLELTDNKKLESKHALLPVHDYPRYFFNVIKTDPTAVLHNADLYPPYYTQVGCTTWHTTDKELTSPDRLTDPHYSPKNHLSMFFAKRLPFVQKVRPLAVATKQLASPTVVWRNYEAGYGVIDLFYPNFLSTSRLQEYFIPVDRITEFLDYLRTVLAEHSVNVLNISLRHVTPNNESYLSWSDKESFAVVIFYDSLRTRNKTEINWTKKLIDGALNLQGTYYLPYQFAGTPEQFFRAYPRALNYFAIKRKYDPDGKFSSGFLETIAHQPSLKMA